ncbi:MAG TPA: hypothetical protein VK540_24220 [Polyangiaceae bacterium]|nr:hypothetical protein [Polyangiaceae bacterium]
MRLELPVLLAARFGEIVRIVIGPHGDEVRLSGLEQAGDVDLERRIAAVVLGHERIIDPHAGFVVDGAEMQDEMLVILETRWNDDRWYQQTA